jgi:hypothetical protein
MSTILIVILLILISAGAADIMRTVAMGLRGWAVS